MCGVFGIVVESDSKINKDEFESGLKSLYKYSESRGKESAGFHSYVPSLGKSWTLKEERRASELLKSAEFKEWTGGPLNQIFSAGSDHTKTPFAVLAHSRLVTNGTSALAANNQPVRVGKVTVIHNGIVVNVDDLWSENREIHRTAEVDTEVISAMINRAVEKGLDPLKATREAFALIRGSASIGWSHDDGDFIILATNTGDLYYSIDAKRGFFAFASERYILEQSLKSFGGEAPPVEGLPAGSMMAVSISKLETSIHAMSDRDLEQAARRLKFFDRPVENQKIDHSSTLPAVFTKNVTLTPYDENLLRYNEQRMRDMKRCSRCVLPETFPFIQFDATGVCNYCHGYKPRYKGVDPKAAKESFLKKIETYRRADGKPDVLVPFSGGRDSSFGLHIIKKEFGLNPITFTYDWGMVTDLARRNVARVCGQLGVQNILVSADIREKRANIRKNVSAWLKSPDLGMIPLFMAGDKHFFSIVNELKGQTGIKLDLWSANPLENTDFKSGFCGVEPDFDKSRLDYLSSTRKIRMALHYAKNFALNPGYLNGSLLDTAKAFFAYYYEPRRDFYFMFNDLVWFEDEVNDVLLNQYNWELAPDTKSTWRIGDGTAPFYNYIYTTAHGFSEFDTFRSNQIREGMMTREKALESVVKENYPRPQAIKWYLDAIGLDFDAVIRRVNQLDTRGLHK